MKQMPPKKVATRWWTPEWIEKAIVLFEYKGDFEKYAKGAYLAAYRLGMKHMYAHLKLKQKPKGYWQIKENCRLEALKYDSRSAFDKGCPGASVASRNNGWFDEICSHMPYKGSGLFRFIYAIEFPRISEVYVGNAILLDRREEEHIIKKIKTNKFVKMNLDTGEEYKFIRFLMPIPKDFVPKHEEGKKNEYASDGWSILNIAKCYSIGKQSYYDKKKSLICAKECKTRSELQCKYQGAWLYIKNHNLRDVAYAHMEGPVQRGTWDIKNNVKDLAFKISTRKNAIL